MKKPRFFLSALSLLVLSGAEAADKNVSMRSLQDVRVNGGSYTLSHSRDAYLPMGRAAFKSGPWASPALVDDENWACIQPKFSTSLEQFGSKDGNIIFKLNEQIGVSFEVFLNRFGDGKHKVLDNNSTPLINTALCTLDYYPVVEVTPYVISPFDAVLNTTEIHIGDILWVGAKIGDNFVTEANTRTIQTMKDNYFISNNSQRVMLGGVRFTDIINTCTVSSSADLTVNMLGVPMSKINSGEEVWGGSTRINLQCSGRAAHATTGVESYITFTDGNSLENRTDILSLDSSSTAKGIGIKLIANEDVAVTFGLDSAAAMNPNQMKLSARRGEQNPSMKLDAYYVKKNGETVTPGTVGASATYTLSYQ